MPGGRVTGGNGENMDHSSRSRQVGQLTRVLVVLAIATVPLVGAGPGAAQTTSTTACTIALHDDQYLAQMGSDFTVDPIGVVANDEICGSDGLVVMVTPPAHGTITGFDDATGGFTYVPTDAHVGADSFTYTLEDVPDVAPATVTITTFLMCLCTTTTLPPPPTTAGPPTTLPVGAGPAAAVPAVPVLTG